MTAARPGWLPADTCPATHEGYRCCRPAGHVGNHEEWQDENGDVTTPIPGRLVAEWPAESGREGQHP